MDLRANSRIILSSLEQNSEGGQWIHWHRSFGTKIHASSYGVEGDGANGTAFQGMGRLGTKITATKGSGVMYVEIAYSYRPIIGVAPISLNDIVEVAAYNIWEMRDLSQVYSSPRVAASTCS